MPSSIRQITGNWDLGFVLSKHSISSIPSGTTSTGRTLFDTKRTEIGEALYRLKYQSDWTRVPVLAEALASTIYPKFQDVGILIPMPASKARPKQPVTEIAKALGALVGIAVFEGLVTKESSAKQLKDIATKAEKLEALGAFSFQDLLEGEDSRNALLIDDLFDTGASLESACKALRGYQKINRLYVAALTWK